MPSLSARLTYCLLLTCFAVAACGPVISSPQTSLDSATLEFFLHPREFDKPTYVLIVEPIHLPSRKLEYHGYHDWCEEYAGPQHLLTAALINSLSRVGNFSLVDPDTPAAAKRAIKLHPHERGPFVIRASIGEFNRSIEKSEHGAGKIEFERDDSFAESLLKFGAFIPLFWFNSLTALPTNWTDTTEQGVVGIEVSALNPKTNEVVTSFPVQGVFSQRTREIGGRFSSGFYSADDAASAAEGAMRAGLNDAALKLFNSLAAAVK